MTNGLADYISEKYREAIEIGIGHVPDTAYFLVSRGVQVFATDIYLFRYRGLKVVLDDITKPDMSVYKGAGLLYSIRPAPEMVIYMKDLARRIKADLIVKALSSEFHDGQIMRYNGETFYIWKFC